MPELYSNSPIQMDVSVPITDANTRAYRMVARIDLPVLNPGDILDVNAEAVFVNDQTINAQVITAVTLEREWPPADSPVSASGVVICKARGPNLNPQQHYQDDTRVGRYVVPTRMEGAALFYRVASVSNAAGTVSSPVLGIPSYPNSLPGDYRTFQCLIHRA